MKRNRWWISLACMTALWASACDDGSSGSKCTVVQNADGGATISCDDGTSATIGIPSPDGCTITHDSTSSTITCRDGTTVTVGPDQSCTVTDAGNGSHTVSCTDGTNVTVGPDQTCTVSDGANGSHTVMCSDGTHVTISPDQSCTVTDGANGSHTVTCTDGTNVTIGPDSTCTVTDNGDGSSTVACTDGTSGTFCHGNGNDSDDDGICDRVDPCPVAVSLAIFFPADPGSSMVTAMQMDLAASPHVTAADVLDPATVPTLATLGAYDAVIAGSDWGYGTLTADAVGDVLADYVDAGGLVVDTMFDHTNWTGNGTQEALGGRWASAGYNAFVPAAQINAPNSADLTLDFVVPSAPELASVASGAEILADCFSGSVYITAGSMNTSSPLQYEEIATWSYEGNTYPAMAVSRDPARRVIALDMAPVGSLDFTNADPTTRDLLACSVGKRLLF